MERTEVVVVGAGLSGLSCADLLHRQGFQVRVLEARGRVGGKTYTAAVGGARVDLGAHWIGPGHERMYRLADELGLEVRAQPTRGRHLTVFADGQRHEHRAELPLRRPLTLLDGIQAFARLELQARRIGKGRRSAGEARHKLDQLTVKQFSDRAFRSVGGRAACELVTALTVGAEPDELSLLQLLAIAERSRGFRWLTAFDGGAQQDYIVGGAEQVAQGLAKRLGTRVELNQPVVAIDQRGRRVCVRTKTTSWEAHRCVVALAPPLAARIQFMPALPDIRQALHRTRMASYAKAVAVYDRPWWRDQGRSGLAVDTSGPMPLVVDGSEPEGPGVLVGLFGGRRSREFGQLPAAARRDLALARFASLIGRRARTAIAYSDIDWDREHYSWGAPLALMPPTLLTQHPQGLSRPVGLVHWAGTETAQQFVGFMEGAVQAGRRAADEVGTALQMPAPMARHRHQRQSLALT